MVIGMKATQWVSKNMFKYGPTLATRMRRKDVRRVLTFYPAALSEVIELRAKQLLAHFLRDGVLRNQNLILKVKSASENLSLVRTHWKGAKGRRLFRQMHLKNLVERESRLLKQAISAETSLSKLVPAFALLKPRDFEDLAVRYQEFLQLKSTLGWLERQLQF